MNCYIISYELKGTRDYTALYEAIKSYGTWAHITESTWAVVTDQTWIQVRDNLIRYLEQSDRIFVVKSGSAAAWNNVLCKHEWLKEHL